MHFHAMGSLLSGQKSGFELKTPTVSFKRKGRGSTLSSVELPNFKPFNIFIYYRD
ncbi:hypothetical protein ES288_A12G280400v1 [Gossypium darwinii]|uniref:Uncharacterized protein n=1 Tax=Gossypium darwinii TaxID=34276 RepID=A0A5D2EFE6_GOSDA|nr:hypothetical protein ES288_A12G280400v1 [Gossypium darwinii]